MIFPESCEHFYFSNRDSRDPASLMRLHVHMASQDSCFLIILAWELAKKAEYTAAELGYVFRFALVPRVMAKPLVHGPLCVMIDDIRCSLREWHHVIKSYTHIPLILRHWQYKIWKIGINSWLGLLYLLEHATLFKSIDKNSKELIFSTVLPVTSTSRLLVDAWNSGYHQTLYPMYFSTNAHPVLIILLITVTKYMT